MGSYDDFDLDIKTTKTNNTVSPASTTNICWAVSSAVVSSAITGCTGDCVTAHCSSGCTSNCSRSTCTCYC